MPAKNSIKTYSENSYYHIYNRGVEKRNIFQDAQDYAVFLSYLKTYLLPKDEKTLRDGLSDPTKSNREKDKILRELRLNNFSDEITLLAYCLMPNHYHLLIKQNSSNSIDKFMNSLGIRYVMYFNKKCDRIGALFQDVYKAVLIETDPQLLYLTSYIHNNPIKNLPKLNLGTQVDACPPVASPPGDGRRVLRAYTSQPSSYPEYLGQRKTKWVHPEEILSYFSKTNPQLSYQNFIEKTDDLSLIEPIQDFVFDD